MPHHVEGNPPGRYRRGECAPGSEYDRNAQRAAGWRATVLRLRFCGVYLPERLLNEQRHMSGLIVSMDGYDAGYSVHLIDEAGGREITRGLRGATVLKRRSDGAMLLRGVEWDEGYLRQWPQTWLCCETPDAMPSVLRQMGAWLDARYTAQRPQQR